MSAYLRENERRVIGEAAEAEIFQHQYRFALYLASSVRVVILTIVVGTLLLRLYMGQEMVVVAILGICSVYYVSFEFLLIKRKVRRSVEYVRVLEENSQRILKRAEEREQSRMSNRSNESSRLTTRNSTRRIKNLNKRTSDQLKLSHVLSSVELRGACRLGDSWSCLPLLSSTVRRSSWYKNVHFLRRLPRSRLPTLYRKANDVGFEAG